MDRERPYKKATVVLLLNEKGELVLARKKQAIHRDGDEIGYSLGTWNGYGGKMEDADRTIFDTAIRELQDESGVKADKRDLDLVTRVYFYLAKNEGNPEPFMEVAFFYLRKWIGDPVEGEEMGPPSFFHRDSIPYDEMMPADKALFLAMFNGERKVYQVTLFGKDILPEIVIIDENLL